MQVDYDARMRKNVVRALCVAAALCCATMLFAQETPPPPDPPKTESQHQDAFSGPIIELTDDKITVTRAILGKPAEKRTFLIKPDTKIEGKLKLRLKVTVGFITTDEGDVARLIVVRPQKK